MTSALINSLGAGHFCFIGVIENSADPPPDHLRISDVNEFYDFIRKSNNYAWRNCDIVEVTPDTNGETEPIELDFQMNGFGRWLTKRQLEIDTTELPEGTQLAFWVPAKKFIGLKAVAVQKPILMTKLPTLVTTEEKLTVATMRQVPISALATTAYAAALVPKKISKAELQNLRTFGLEPRKIIRLTGLNLDKNEKLTVRLIVKFPKNVGMRDALLAIRERNGEAAIGAK